MVNTPRLSVIVPVLNRENLIVRALDSIVSSCTAPMEIIVVDNGSKDSTPAVVRNWIDSHSPDPRSSFHLLFEPHPGPAAARQRGLDAARGEWVYFFDSDDTMRPGALDSLLALTETNPAAELIVCQLRYHSASGHSRLLTPQPGRRPIVTHFHHCLLRTHSMLTRRDLLARAGGWNQTLRIWEDWELGLRLLLLSPHIIYSPLVAADIFFTPDSVTGDLYSSRADRYEPALQAAAHAIQVSSHPDKPLLIRLVHYRRMLVASLFAREKKRALARTWKQKALRMAPPDRRLRTVLRLVYAYSSLGLPGAWFFATPLLAGKKRK